MNFVPTLTFREARACVLAKVPPATPSVETVPLADAAGRVIARDIRADRDSPATDRSIRDGYAVRAADLPGTLRIIGEIRAGALAERAAGPGECVEIMTGAPMPAGADAVVMIEHTSRDGDSMTTDRTPKPGEYVNPRASETRAGDALLAPGKRLTFADVALLAMSGHSAATVFARPRVALLSTGDELVEPHEAPAPHQVRNSNVYALAAQVARAGGCPDILPIARDNEADTRRLIERGLAADLLLLSGGVSAGKYDLVERVLDGLGAEFFFDRVLIQPGAPLVFGRARGRFFFGLPGNPASTMVTFEVLARAAMERLGGEIDPPFRITEAPLAEPFRHKPGLDRFLPATLAPDGRVTPIRWHGSSDIPSQARANAWIIARPERESWNAGDRIEVYLP